MHQTLFHIPRTVFDGGLLLAVWAVFSVVLLAWLVRRQGWNADTLGYLPLIVVVAAAIRWVLPALCDEQGLPIRGYGMMVLLAVLAGLGLLVWRARRAQVDREMVLALAFWMILPGILGGRALYVAKNWSDQYWPIYLDPDPEKGGLLPLLGAIANLAAGGLVVLGAFMGGMVGLFFFWRKHRIPLLATCDLFAPSLVLGLAIGRIGCLMNGCCYGGTCELPWAVTFPPESPPYIDEGLKTEPLGYYGLSLRNQRDPSRFVVGAGSDSPAYGAGLRNDDLIVKIDGRDLATAEDGVRLLRDVFRKYKEAVLTLADGRTVTLPARHVPALFGASLGDEPKSPPIVRQVLSHSMAAHAGLCEGDQLTTINGRFVPNAGEAENLLGDSFRERRSPHLVLSDGHELTLGTRSLPLHPTQIYAAVGALLLCLVLLAAEPFTRRDGAVFALMLTLYPIIRFLEESIRTDEKPIWGTGLHISQNISLVMLACGIGLWFYIRRQPKGKVFPRHENALHLTPNV
jgi:phosphatidylglycerol:prolipoprotein diacylglycerol transferase